MKRRNTLFTLFIIATVASSTLFAFSGCTALLGTFDVTDTAAGEGGIINPNGKVNGGACGAPIDCQSNQCMDSVCCESACSGPCETCNLAGQAGRCLPVTNDPQCPTNPGGDGGGADADAAALLCGYAGEPCCEGPFAPCRTGTACSPQKACVVNDVWAVGYIFNFSSFNQDGVSAHYDGTAWKLEDPLDPSIIPESIWASAGGYRAVGEMGKVYLLLSNPYDWRACGPSGFGCSYANTTANLWAIFGFTPSDFWVAGTNVMFQCGGGGACVSKTTGITGTWGTGNFTGTSSTDLWYSGSALRALHYDGTTWKAHDGVQARALWARAPNDVWGGDKTLQHYDGMAWSPEYLIDGAPTPGTIFSVSGTATDDVWAVGYDGSIGAHPSFAAHWDGTAWKKKPLPAGTADLDFVWAASRREAFAAANNSFYKWDGTAWTAMANPKLGDGGAFGGRWRALTGLARPRP